MSSQPGRTKEERETRKGWAGERERRRRSCFGLKEEKEGRTSVDENELHEEERRR